MGVNNRQRRAAKQRKRARGRSTGPRPGASAPPRPEWDEAGSYAFVELQLTATVRRLGHRRHDLPVLERVADSLVRRVAPAPRFLVQTVLGDVLARQTRDVVAGGWGPADLAELVGRCAEPTHVPALLTVLHDEARRNPDRGAAWLGALDELGPDPRLRFATVEELASGLQVAALLAHAPLLEADSFSDGAADAEAHPKLARVRALLAKAESTTFEEEAEALSAKAQELISRYSLGRLLGESADPAGGSGMVVRRIWLDAPYVRAKAALVHEVAAANHARAAVSERCGFSLVVGAGHDVEAVELLVTSLLVQASRAMLRHGRRQDGLGTSRTRSFRQSFLLAYAGRIGERLREATAAVAAEDAERFLPVLRDHDARVTEAFDAMVPHTVGQAASISNHEGWEAGLAAADLALIDVHGRIAEGTG